MPLSPEQLAAIDRHRAEGATPKDTLRILGKLVGPDQAKGALEEYMATPVADGRPRAEVNPGDPAERRHFS